MEGDNTQPSQLYSFNCSDGGKVQVSLKLEGERKTLVISFKYISSRSSNFPIILHWGIVQNSKSKWTQPINCLFLSNGTTPEKNNDGISCRTELVPSDDFINYYGDITLDLFHLKSSHKRISIKNSEQNGIENCEHLLEWLHSENKEWGISFVLYSILGCSNNQQQYQNERLWIKDFDRNNSDFFVPVGRELFFLDWIDLIVSDDFYKELIKTPQVNIDSYNKPVLSRFQISERCVQITINDITIHSHHDFTSDNNIVWTISSKINKDENNNKSFAVIIYTSMSHSVTKSDSELPSREYELILHFGFTKSMKKIDWVSPYKYSKYQNFSKFSEINNRAAEINFVRMKNYSKCKLIFPIEILTLFEGFVFVIRQNQVSNNTSKWVKSERNADFAIMLPNCTYLTKENSIESSETKERKSPNWSSNLKRFVSATQYSTEEFLKYNLIKHESIIINKIIDLSEGIGKLHAISALKDESIIIKLRTISKRNLILHCGLIEYAYRGKRKWRSLPKNCLSAMSTQLSEATDVDMPIVDFVDESIFEQEIQIQIREINSNVGPFVCVFKTVDEHGIFCWHKEGGKDIEIPTSFQNKTMSDWKGLWTDIISSIIRAEVEWESITLMHRYNFMDQTIKKCSADFINETYKNIFDSSEILWYQCKTNNYFENKNNSLRTVNCNNVKDAIFRGEEFWGWIMIWMRFNSLGVLDWQRNYNTAPRLLAHSAETVSNTVISKWVDMPIFRYQIRLIIQTIIRGGSRGQEIRDRILQIMHKNHIPEEHGTFYEQWHQKLHNNTTPDDVGICRSIIAYLRSNGSEEIFSKVLHEQGLSWEKIGSYERPITSKPYIPSCIDINELATDFEQYLEILVDVHEALNLQRSFHYSMEYLNDKTKNICTSIIFGENKRFDNTVDLIILHDRLMVINKAREEILNLIYDLHGGNISSSNSSNCTAIKEIMYLDLGLESLQCMFIQTISTINNNHVNIAHLIDEMNSLIWILFGHDPCNKELEAIIFDWKMFQKFEHSSENYHQILKSLLDRLQLFIGALMDKIFANWNPKATFFGESIGLNKDDPIVEHFMDEVLRSTLIYTISLQIKRINMYLLSKSNPNELNDWQLISYNPSWSDNQTFTGIFKKVNRITDLLEDPYKKIVSCSSISGEEDIPMNVIGIILTNPESSPDMLSHLSVRARNMSVLLAVCQNPNIVSDCIYSLNEDEIIDVHVTSDQRLEINKNNKILDKSELASIRTSNQFKVKYKSKLYEFKNKIKEMKKWILLPDEMNSTNVGQKALNLVKLKKSLTPNSYKLPFFVPSCVSLPFGTLNQLINNHTFEKFNSQLSKLEEISVFESSEMSKILENISHIIEYEVEPCEQLLEELISAMKMLEKIDIEDLKIDYTNAMIKSKIQKNSKSATLIWEKIKRVWMSVYRPISFINMKKIGWSLSNIYMSVVVQRLMNAKYAFVLHSQNPAHNESICLTEYDEMYGELVIGLGETLVSNTLGKSMGFTAARKKNSKNYTDTDFIQKVNIVSFPSKSIAMFDIIHVDGGHSIQEYGLPCNFIFRSDSNAEDIEGFAGAGVFQSIQLIDPTCKYVKYMDQKIIIDNSYRNEIIKMLAVVAFYIQDEFDQIPQDIEGCIIEESTNIGSNSIKIAIVQSRPQV
ncbi:R1-like alpha-glucan water dikinase [Cryptosporidium canis]|uniref:R1-like alpha-glucan water dikinase n=1 Tax=Cryptosporidium canis TaxID=195482 RepID=A0A9D5DGQ4_9CRYT|nr:R1-like alpha-glucan water dikinase [Cryptosporidium canis]